MSKHLTTTVLLLVAYLNKNTSETVDILFEGDSDIELWDIQAYEHAKNVGVGGATCADVLDDLDDTLERYNSKWIVLVCGENDFPARSANDTFALFQSIVTKIQSSGARIVYMGTKPEPATVDLHAQYREYDALIQQHAINLAATKTPPPLIMIDVYNGFEAMGNPLSLYANDQLHLSEAGYSHWDQWLNQALENNTCILWRSGICIQQSNEGLK